MLDVFTNYDAFIVLAPIVQVVVLLIAAGLVVGAVWLVIQIILVLGSLF